MEIRKSFTFLRLKWLYKTITTAATESNKWKSVIGLEIHAQIAVKTKLFSGSATKFAAPINSQVSQFDAALPGTLPVINKQCVKAAVLTALALSCQINQASRFDRKHYFYADLPQGYQITQHRQPLGRHGKLSYINNIQQKTPYERTARIHQVQLEQDSGKSLHDPTAAKSYIDLNRAGIGLMEIVTEPDFESATEAVAFVRELQLLLKTIGTCDCKMEEGSLRVDANISIHHEGEPLGVRTEVKNLNSLRALRRAVDFELQRQMSVLDSGGEVLNETMSFSSESNETVPMRDKEKLQDYRFMPEPNLPPLILYNNETVARAKTNDKTQVINIDTLKKSMPKLPHQSRQLLKDDLGLTWQQCITFVYEPGVLEYFYQVLSHCSDVKAQTVAFNIVYHVLGEIRRRELESSQCAIIKPTDLAAVIRMKQSGYVNTSIASKVVQLMFDGSCESAEQLVKSHGWKQVTDHAVISSCVDDVISKNNKLVKQYHKGKQRALNSIIKQVQQKLNECAHDETLKTILEEKLRPFKEK